jgi:hypothetical protein
MAFIYPLFSTKKFDIKKFFYFPQLYDFNKGLIHMTLNMF